MCQCKKTECRTKQCSCRKSGSVCQSACTCVNCKNVTTVKPTEPPTPPPVLEKKEGKSEKPTSKEEDLIDMPVFCPQMKILSWNMCNFSAFTSDFSKRTTSIEGEPRELSEKEISFIKSRCREAFEFILKNELPDVMILQEFPKHDGMARVSTISSFMGDEYDYVLGEIEHLEHVFFWRKSTIEPLKPKVDSFVRPIMNVGLKRPGGTMRLIHKITKQVFIVTSVHLKSGGKEETHLEMQALMENYNKKIHGRYGSEFCNKTSSVCHIIGGDFNMRPDPQEGWEISGDAKTKTSSGERGYDFFLLNQECAGKYKYFQRELVQSVAKNSRKCVLGISDHDPVVLTLWRYRC